MPGVRGTCVGPQGARDGTATIFLSGPTPTDAAEQPTCIPVSGEHPSKLTLMSESLRGDGRVWVPKDGGEGQPRGDPRGRPRLLSGAPAPGVRHLVPRDIAAQPRRCSVGPTGLGVYRDFSGSIERIGRDGVAAKYGNLFDMYQRITGEAPSRVPMRIYPAVHYTMAGCGSTRPLGRPSQYKRYERSRLAQPPRMYMFINQGRSCSF